MMQRRYYAALSQLAAAFADYSAAILRHALAKNQQASLVVPGGHTPRHYLPQLGQQSLRWRDVSITLSDERWVDTKASQSNERLITACFLSLMPEPAHFVSLKTHHPRPSQAIDTIHKRLAALPLPFSLTVLGLGEDGHIASLFPGMNPDPESDLLCVSVEPPIAPSPRISLSLKALTNSQNIALVVTGTGKRRLVDKLTNMPASANRQVPFLWLLQYSRSPIIIFETDDT